MSITFLTMAFPKLLSVINGAKFCALELEHCFVQLGIDHCRTTPYHAQSNGKTERFNSCFKELLECLTWNATSTWEERVADALWAHHISVSSITGHTPYYLHFALHPRVPLSKLLRPEARGLSFGNRLDDFATALTSTHENTLTSREYIHERLARCANSGNLQVLLGPWV